MPVVPTINSTPSVGIEIVKQPHASNVDQSSGIGRLGEAMQNISAMGMQIKESLDTVAAEEALLRFEKSKNEVLFNPENGYFNTQGKHAVDGADGTNQTLTKLQQQYAQELKSPVARSAFQRASQARLIRDQESIMRHASKGQREFEVSTIQALQENAIEGGSLYWNNQEELDIARSNGIAAIRDEARITGMSPEALKEKIQTFESAFVSGAIQSALVGKNIDRANELLAAGKEQGVFEGPDLDKLTPLIRKTEVEVGAERLVAAVQGKPLTEQLKIIGKHKDHEIAKAAMAEVSFQDGIRKKIEDEQQTSTLENYHNQIFVQGKPPSPLSVDKNNILTPAQKQTVKGWIDSLNSGGDGEGAGGGKMDVLVRQGAFLQAIRNMRMELPGWRTPQEVMMQAGVGYDIRDMKSLVDDFEQIKTGTGISSRVTLAIDSLYPSMNDKKRAGVVFDVSNRIRERMKTTGEVVGDQEIKQFIQESSEGVRKATLYEMLPFTHRPPETKGQGSFTRAGNEGKGVSYLDRQLIQFQNQGYQKPRLVENGSQKFFDLGYRGGLYHIEVNGQIRTFDPTNPAHFREIQKIQSLK